MGLRDLSKKEKAPAPEPEAVDEVDQVDDVEAPRHIERPEDLHWKHEPARAIAVERIEVDAVVGGCLMKITLARGADPSAVLPYLKSLDPNCKVRDDFPSKGNFGKRETKRARLVTINLKASDNGLFIDLVCQGETDMSVRVSKKKAGEFRQLIGGLDALTDEHLEKLDNAIASKGQATVILDADEAVEVEYWTGDDGAAFLEALHRKSEVAND